MCVRVKCVENSTFCFVYEPTLKVRTRRELSKPQRSLVTFAIAEKRAYNLDSRMHAMTILCSKSKGLLSACLTKKGVVAV